MVGFEGWVDLVDKWPLTPLILSTFIASYLITYLSFFPRTRWIRIAIWPVSVFSYLAALGRIGEPLLDMRFAHNGVSLLMAVFGSGVRYTFTSTPPVFQHLPEEPALGFIRKTRAGKAFHLLYTEHRRLGISPNPPVKHGRSYLPAFALQLVRFIFCITIFDIITYPIVYFAPTTYGSIHLRDHPSFVGWVKDLSREYRMPWWMIWTMFAWSYGLGNVFGIEMGAHVTALVMIGIGYDLEAEWPRVSDWWIYKASSLNEFWGKRYHQLFREFLLLWSSPFQRFGRSIHILSTFFMSFLIHVAMFGALNRHFSIFSNAIFFVGQGLGCVFERYLLRHHGIRVGGLAGRIWMTAVLTLTSFPLVNDHHEMGWAGGIRKGFVETPQSSAVQWILYTMGRPNLISGKSNTSAVY